MQAYTLAFVFDKDDRVALIKKNRPAMLAGKWNGIGGKVEQDELLDLATVRELKEEANLTIDPDDLVPLGFYGDGKTYSICLSAARVETFDDLKTMTDEEVRAFTLEQIFLGDLTEDVVLDRHASAFIQLAISEFEARGI